MATIRSLVTEIKFLINASSLADVKAKIAEVKRELNGISTAKVKVEADRASFATAREAISGLKRQLSSVRDTVVNVRVRRTGGGGGGGGEGHDWGHGGGSGLLGHVAGVAAGLFSAEEFVKMTNEWAALSATIAVATRNQDDFVKSRDAVLKIARTARVAPEPVANLFANLRQVQDVAKMSDDDVVNVAGVITKGLAVAHQSAARNAMTIRQIDNMIGRGKLTEGQLHMIRRDNNLFERLMEDGMGGKAGVDKFLKSSKNNAEGIKNIFLNMTPIVNKGFAALPLTFSNAMASIRVSLTEILGKVFVETGAISDALTPIVDAFEWLRDATERAATALGGYRNLATALEIGVLGFLTAAIAKTTVWAARMAIVQAPWILLAAAVAAVGLAIQDVWVWMHGGESVTGRILGDFQKWKPTIDEAKASVAAVWQALVSYPWAAQLSGIGLNWKNVKAFIDDVGAGIRENFTELSHLFGKMGDVNNLGKDRTLKGWLDDNFAQLKTIIGYFQTLDGWLNKVNGYATGAGKWVHDNVVAPVVGGAQAVGHVAVTAANDTAYGLYTSGDGKRSLYGDVSSWASRTRQANGGSLLPSMTPSILSPSNSTVTHAPSMTINNTNNITATSAQPAAIAAAASQGTSQGVTTSLGSSMRSFRQSIAPAAEAGVAY